MPVRGSAERQHPAEPELSPHRLCQLVRGHRVTPFPAGPRTCSRHIPDNSRRLPHTGPHGRAVCRARRRREHSRCRIPGADRTNRTYCGQRSGRTASPRGKGHTAMSESQQHAERSPGRLPSGAAATPRPAGGPPSPTVSWRRSPVWRRATSSACTPWAAASPARSAPCATGCPAAAGPRPRPAASRPRSARCRRRWTWRSSSTTASPSPMSPAPSGRTSSPRSSG